MAKYKPTHSLTINGLYDMNHHTLKVKLDDPAMIIWHMGPPLVENIGWLHLEG